MAMVDIQKQPLGVGSLVGETFRLFFRHFLVFVGLMLLPVAILVVIGGAIGAAGIGPGIEAGMDGTAAVAVFAVVLLFFAAYMAVIGMITLAAYDIKIGKKVRPLAYLAQVGKSILPIIGCTVVLFIGAAIGMLVLIFLPAASGSLGMSTVGGFAFFALVVFMAVKFSIIVPTIMIERIGLSALSRTVSLTRDYFWSILGALLLMYIILTLVSLAVGAVLGLGFGFAFDTPGGQARGAIGMIFNILFTAITYAIPAVFAALLYARLREVKEGLGMENLASVFE